MGERRGRGGKAGEEVKESDANDSVVLRAVVKEGEEERDGLERRAGGGMAGQNIRE